MNSKLADLNLKTGDLLLFSDSSKITWFNLFIKEIINFEKDLVIKGK